MKNEREKRTQYTLPLDPDDFYTEEELIENFSAGDGRKRVAPDKKDEAE